MNDKTQMHKFDKIPAYYKVQDMLLCTDDDVGVEEKLDGANFRFKKYADTIIFGSRTQELIKRKPFLKYVPRFAKSSANYIYTKIFKLNAIEEDISKNFKAASDHVKERVKSENLLDDHIYFGECMTSHTIAYDWPNTPSFVLFDIYNVKESKYLDYDKVIEFAKKYNFEIPQLVFKGKIKDLPKLDDNFVPISKYASKSSADLKAEGIIIKNFTTGQRCKYVRDAFKEKNSDTFKSNKPLRTNGFDTDKITFRFITDARIEKNIHKLEDEGIELDMPMMKYLPTKVYEDLIEEEYGAICYSSYRVNFKDLKRLVTKRCLIVLRRVLDNNFILNKK
jgi:hypothetical protein